MAASMGKKAAGEIQPAKSRAGRPTAARAEAIDNEILDAARTHFLEGGFESTSMEAIALGAGVSKGTLYARYPNKVSLLRAVYERHAVEWLGYERRPESELPKDFAGRLKFTALRIFGSLGAEEVRAFRKLVRPAHAADADMVRVFFDIGYAPTIDDLADELERGAEALGVKPRAPRRVAEMFVSSLLGWHDVHEFRGVEATPAEADAFADHLITVMLAGVSAW